MILMIKGQYITLKVHYICFQKVFLSSLNTCYIRNRGNQTFFTGNKTTIHINFVAILLTSNGPCTVHGLATRN